MNVRKPSDYSSLFAALDTLMTANLSQMKLYCEIGRLISHRPEKGAAVAAAGYLQGTYPDAAGFSPRNLRRMRDFYRTYESTPEVMAEAMTIGWTKNVVILETELTLQEKAWYIQAVQRFVWSKLELARQITSAAHLEITLDLLEEVCYTEENSSSKCVNNDENSLHLLLQHSLQPDGRVCDERSGEESRTRNPIPHRICGYQHRGNQHSGPFLGGTQADGVWHQLHWENCATDHQLRLRQIQPLDRGGSGQSAEHTPHLRRRLHRQDALADGLHRPPRDVADLWYTDDFETTWQDVLVGCRGLLDVCKRQIRCKELYP